MTGSFFALISRMRNIRRWGLMRNSVDENIQEHSHMTAVLAHALALIRRDVYGLKSEPEKAAAVALYHDASEIITGDMPTPVKYLNGSIAGAYKEVESAAMESCWRCCLRSCAPLWDILCCKDESINSIVRRPTSCRPI